MRFSVLMIPFLAAVSCLLFVESRVQRSGRGIAVEDDAKGEVKAFEKEVGVSADQIITQLKNTDKKGLESAKQPVLKWYQKLAADAKKIVTKVSKTPTLASEAVKAIAKKVRDIVGKAVDKVKKVAVKMVGKK